MRYLVIGGTGSLGKALIKALYEQGPYPFTPDITVLSREELKQLQLKAQWPEVKTVIGDVRDKESLESHIREADCVFNFAALKHVDICEANALESHKINLQGAINVANLCAYYGTPISVFCSTDKAVLPINVYGFHKAAAERYYLNQASGATAFNVFRWGNVLGSRGSVIHRFMETLLNERKVYITDKRMTRFWIHIDTVAGFMLKNINNRDGRVLIPEMKAASITMLARAVAEIVGVKDYETKITGIRPGEKIHECLKSEHEEFGGCIRSDTAEKFTLEELCELVERTIG